MPLTTHNTFNGNSTVIFFRLFLASVLYYNWPVPFSNGLEAQSSFLHWDIYHGFSPVYHSFKIASATTSAAEVRGQWSHVNNVIRTRIIIFISSTTTTVLSKSLSSFSILIRVARILEWRPMEGLSRMWEELVKLLPKLRVNWIRWLSPPPSRVGN